MTDYDYSSDFSVDGVITSSKQGKVMGSVDTMPAASSEYEGMTLQFVGTTTASFTFGRFYTCTHTSGTYQWTEVGGGGGGTGTVKKVKVNSVDHDPDATGTVDIGTVITAHQDITGKQDVATLETAVADKGFTKNAGTITSVKFDSSTVSSGEVDLGTIIHAHQDITTKQDKATLETDVAAKGFIKDGVTKIKINGTEKTPSSGLVDLGNLVTSDISSTTGVARIFNEADGGGSKFEFATGSKSFIGVNNDESGIMAQMYALGADNKGTRINVKKSAIYYTKGQTGPTVTDNDEIAVVGDFTASETESTATGVKTAKSVKLNGTEWNLPTGSSGTVNKVKVNGTEHSPDASGIVDIGEYIGKLGDVTGAPAGTKYRFPYHFETPVQGTDGITAKFHTLIIDDKSNGGDYTITIPSADVAGNKAGLYNKTLADAKVDAVKVDSTLKAEIANDGNMIYGVITESDNDRTVTTQTENDISAYVTDGTTAGKTELILNKDGAYLQRGSEVGVTVQDGQALVRKDALDGKVNKVTESGDFKVSYGGDETNVEIKSDAKYSPTHTGESELMVSSIAGTYLINKVTQSGTTKQSNLLVMPDKAYYFHDSIAVAPSAEREIMTRGDVILQLGDVPGAAAGTKYNLPYYFYTVPSASNIVVHTKTVSLDNQKTQGDYSLTVGGMDGTNAGLYTKALADAKVDLIKNTSTTNSIVYGVNKSNTQTSFKVVEDYTGTADDVLAASVGKDLDDRIKAISTLGRFLSTWDCTTGLPGDNPTTLPYAYQSGDYYTVSKTGTVNVRPDGSSYTGAASTKLETETVKINDIYRYTSTGWVLQSQAVTTVTFASLVGQPRDNSNLATELDKYMAKLPKETYSGLDYRFPFHIETPVQNQDNITAKFHTLVLNDGTTRDQYTVTIPAADISGDKAGLYTKTLANAKQDALTAITDADIDALAWS